MAARYLIRFDDVCETMNWKVWKRVENALVRRGVRPIVAVVPDNRDPSLSVGTARADFWNVVREWQARGWVIGWHGYQHDYVTPSGGLMGIHNGSEFAGLAEGAQRAKLAAAYGIFEKNGVRPSIWVAPGHSFDMRTIHLLREFGVRAISDGFYWRTVTYGGCTWVPQQLWRFRPMPFGVWTVCLHTNSWMDRDVEGFETSLDRFSSAIVDAGSLLQQESAERTLLDSIFSAIYRRAVLVRRAAQH